MAWEAVGDLRLAQAGLSDEVDGDAGVAEDLGGSPCKQPRAEVAH
jgi:hypothetical protein